MTHQSTSARSRTSTSRITSSVPLKKGTGGAAAYLKNRPLRRPRPRPRKTGEKSRTGTKDEDDDDCRWGVCPMGFFPKAVLPAERVFGAGAKEGQRRRNPVCGKLLPLPCGARSRPAGGSLWQGFARPAQRDGRYQMVRTCG
jgi:hypothetical protein